MYEAVGFPLRKTFLTGHSWNFENLDGLIFLSFFDSTTHPCQWDSGPRTIQNISQPSHASGPPDSPPSPDIAQIACDSFRETIEKMLGHSLQAKRIRQDLVDEHPTARDWGLRLGQTPRRAL
jgi:hypothetical protein